MPRHTSSPLHRSAECQEHSHGLHLHLRSIVLALVLALAALSIPVLAGMPSWVTDWDGLDRLASAQDLHGELYFPYLAHNHVRPSTLVATDLIEERQPIEHPFFKLIIENDLGLVLSSSSLLVLVDLSEPGFQHVIGEFSLQVQDPFCLTPGIAYRSGLLIATCNIESEVGWPYHRRWLSVWSLDLGHERNGPPTLRHIGSHDLGQGMALGTPILDRDRVLLPAGDGFLLFDVRDPGRPRAVGERRQLDEMGSCKMGEVRVRGDAIYIASVNCGLWVIDSSRPDKLRTTLETREEGESRWSTIALDGDRLFVQSRTPERVAVYQLDDPMRPSAEGSVDQETIDVLDARYQVFLIPPIAALHDRLIVRALDGLTQSHGALVLRRGREGWAIETFVPMEGIPYRSAIDRGRVAYYGYEGIILVLDLDNDPESMAIYKAILPGGVRRIQSVAYQHPWIYLLDRRALHVYRADRSGRKHVLSEVLPNGARFASAMLLSGDRLYVAAERVLLVYDLHRPDRPSVVGMLSIKPGTHRLALDGHFLYLLSVEVRHSTAGADRMGRISVIDVSDARSPRHHQRLEDPDWWSATSIELAGAQLLMGAGTRRNEPSIRVFGRDGLGDIVYLGSTYCESSSTDLRFDGHRLYMAGDRGVFAMGFSRPPSFDFPRTLFGLESERLAGARSEPLLIGFHTQYAHARVQFMAYDLLQSPPRRLSIDFGAQGLEHASEWLPQVADVSGHRAVTVDETGKMILWEAR